MNNKHLFIVASCVYFATEIENPLLRFLSPASIALLISFPMTILAIGKSRFNLVPILALIYAAAACGILYWQQVYLDCLYSFGVGNARIVGPVLFFIVTWILFSHDSEEDLIKGLQLALKCLLIVLVIDTVCRIATPLLSGANIVSFYAYKVHSPFYIDSNFHCMNCLIMLELTYYLEKHTSQSFSKQRVATLVLSFLTLSRSLIIGIALYYIGRYILLSIKKGNFLMLINTGIVAIIAIVYSLPEIETDGSFKTKTEIIDAVQDICSSDSYDYLIGYGIGNYKNYSEAVLGRMRSCHNLLGLAVEMGALWSLLTLLFWIGIYKITNGFLQLLAIPLMAISAISIFPGTYLGPVYMMLALVGIVELQNKEQKMLRQCPHACDGKIIRVHDNNTNVHNRGKGACNDSVCRHHVRLQK